MSSSDWTKIVGNLGISQYESRISSLKKSGKETKPIEKAVESTLLNVQQNDCRSLVIFGEPQSGKTEMMIALNAKLLDEGFPILINLVTDSVDLLEQNLKRFRGSGLNPSPKQFNELPRDPRRLKGRSWVVFCKKNARDLEKLISFLRLEKELIIIDDEADYASPDGNVNKPEYDKTKINKLISKLLGEDGRYIGVTATPARLNLNNTFQNESESWVDFMPHSKYVGQDFFFPSSGSVQYRLNSFKSDHSSEKAELEKAILHFLCGVAQLHSKGMVENFTMLVHTSGKRAEHAEDVEVIDSTLSTLSSPMSGGFERMRKKLYEIAMSYSDSDSDSIGEFVLRNINKRVIVEINSSKPAPGKVAQISSPDSLFSFGVGGNIISRGVTFDNLLSMYFARGVKGKLAQDTYIQRARMFGSREKYKKYFQLWIPEDLMGNWSKCFSFHKLALESLRTGAGAPVWLADHKTIPTAAASIDKSSVDFDGGEMSWGIFEYGSEIIPHLFERRGRSDKEVLDGIRAALNDNEFPGFLYNYLLADVGGSGRDVSFHKPGGFGMISSKYDTLEVENIRRKKGIFANTEFGRSESPSAKHHLKVYYNGAGKARLFYKINGGSIKFIRKKS